MKRVPTNKFTKTNVQPTGNVRRRGLVPQQTGISVQNIPSYATPEGAAMANEEMRRLKLKVSEIASQVTTTISATSTGNAATPTKLVKVVTEKEAKDEGVTYDPIDIKQTGIVVSKDATELDFRSQSRGIPSPLSPYKEIGKLEKHGIEFDVRPSGGGAHVMAGVQVRIPRKYVHTQDAPATEWTIPHNLGTHPQIEIVDFTGRHVYAAQEDIDLNNSVIYCSIPSNGYAYCF